MFYKRFVKKKKKNQIFANRLKYFILAIYSSYFVLIFFIFSHFLTFLFKLLTFASKTLSINNLR